MREKYCYLFKFCNPVSFALALGAGTAQQLAMVTDRLRPFALWKRRPDGIFVAPFEQGEIGPDLFRKACEFDQSIAIGLIVPVDRPTG